MKTSMITTKPKTQRLAISKSIYPLGYNKNNPLDGFNEWAQYIHTEARLLTSPPKPRINHELANSLINMSRLVQQAKEQIR